MIELLSSPTMKKLANRITISLAKLAACTACVGRCQFRKAYTTDNHFIEKCNGFTFEFHDPNIAKLGAYMALFTEFFPKKKTLKGIL
jgi:hypothetical protein